MNIIFYVTFLLFKNISAKNLVLEAQFEKLEVKKDLVKGISVFAKDFFQKNSSILEVPFDLAISPKSEYALSDYFINFSSEAQLIIRFIYETHYPSSNFIKNYIYSLPKVLYNYPFWKEEEISLFLDENEALFMEEFKKFEEILSTTEYKTLAKWENWIYSIGIIASRAFLYVNKTVQYPVLIPYLDYFNYDPNFIKEFNSGYKVDEKSENFLLKSEKNFSIGEEIVWSYGEKMNNFDLIWNYGFFVKDNPYNCIEIKYFRQKIQVCRHELLEKIKFISLKYNRVEILKIKFELNEEIKKIRKKIIEKSYENNLLTDTFIDYLNFISLVTFEIDKILLKSYFSIFFEHR